MGKYDVDYHGLSLCVMPKRYSAQDHEEYGVFCDQAKCTVSKVYKDPIDAINEFLRLRSHVTKRTN